jgi:hypothetical protein
VIGHVDEMGDDVGVPADRSVTPCRESVVAGSVG